MLARKKKPAVFALVVFGVALIMAQAWTVQTAVAEEPYIDLNKVEVIRSTLEAQTGKRVKVKLASGQEMEGKVLKVGAHAVLLAELTGMEFFDATVRLDQVAAVMVRARSK